MSTFPPGTDPATQTPPAPADTAPPASSAPATDTAPPASSAASAAATTTPAAKRHQLGDTIEVKGFDPYLGAGGEEVSRYGIVVALDTLEGDDGTTRDAVRVAWLDAVSDPIATADLDLA